MSYDMKHRPGTESIPADKTDDPTDRPDITDSDRTDAERTDPEAVRAEETDVDETDVDETDSDETDVDEARAEEIRAGDTTTGEARTDETTDEDVEKARADETTAETPGDGTAGEAEEKARSYAPGDGDREATDLTEAVRAEAEADRPEDAASTAERDTEPVGQPWAGAGSTPEASTVGLPGASGDTTGGDERAIGRASVDTTGADEAWNDDVVDAYRLRWREIQIDFVDDPSVAVRRAEDLIEEVVQAWTSSLQANRSSLQSWRDDAKADTERLRLTLRGYRELLDRLCG